MKYILLIIVIIWFVKHFIVYPVKVGKAHLTVFFGIPGAGKTTVAAYMARAYNKKKIPVFSNVAIKNTYQIDAQKDIGNFKMSDKPSLLILDEAACEFNNRNYKSMPMSVIRYLKYHRHFKQEVLVFSQSYDDFDITIRRLAYNLFLLKRSKIPFCVKLIPIRRSIGINDQTKKPDDEYSLTPWWLGWLYNRRIFAPLVWNDFNSWEQYDLPVKSFEKYPAEIFDKKKEPKKSKVKEFLKLYFGKVKTNMKGVKLKKKIGSLSTNNDKNFMRFCVTKFERWWYNWECMIRT